MFQVTARKKGFDELDAGTLINSNSSVLHIVRL